MSAEQSGALHSAYSCAPSPRAMEGGEVCRPGVELTPQHDARSKFLHRSRGKGSLSRRELLVKLGDARHNLGALHTGFASC